MSTTTEFFNAIASRDDDSGEVIATLVASDPTLAATPNEQGISPLMFALYCQRRKVATLLLETGVVPGIFEIAAMGKIEELTSRLDADAKTLMARSPDGFTLLHLACFFGHVGCVKLLIERGSEVNIAAENESRVHPIHSAAACNSAVIVTLLLGAGAEADARQHHDYTALMSAAMHNNLDMAKALLDAGANPNQKSEDDRTPISMAQESGHVEMVEGLEKAGGNVQ